MIFENGHLENQGRLVVLKMKQNCLDQAVITVCIIIKPLFGWSVCECHIYSRQFSGDKTRHTAKHHADTLPEQ